MKEKEIINQLKNYKYTCEKIEDVNQEIIKYNELIEATRNTSKAVTYDQPKISETYKNTDTTYQAVEKIIDFYAAKVSEWENRLEELFKMKKDVEDMMEKLNPIERKILELKYYKGLRWRQVARHCNYTERHCKRICHEAIKRIS